MMTDQPPWYRQIGAALTKHIVLKAIGTPTFIALFFVAYLHLLKHPAFAVSIMPFTALDALIPYQPSTMPLYLSLWVYVSLPSSLLSTRRELLTYASAMTATCLTGLIIFYVWPSAVPAASIDWSQHASMAYLKSVDAGGNAFPSLHVATAVFSAMWLHDVLRRFRAPDWLLVINSAWCAGIIYSTLATRQHVIVDVIGGVILGAVMAQYALRKQAKSTIP